jgi:hypothetical protein
MSVPIIVAPYLSQSPSLNADVAQQWRDAQVFDDFQSRGRPLTQRSRAFVGYDAQALYFAFVLSESQTHQLRCDTTDTRRSITARPWFNDDDTIQVLIDPLRDGVNYRHFLVNPAGKSVASRGAASPQQIESDYDWQPDGWAFRAEIEASQWTVRMKIPARAFGLDALREGMQLGLNMIRERSPEPHETSFFTPDTMSWTTQWTSHIVYEPSEFGVLALGSVVQSPRPFAVVQWHAPRPSAPLVPGLLPEARDDAAAKRALPTLADRHFWCIHPPLEAFKGMDRSRLAPFAPRFGWRVHMEVTDWDAVEAPAGEEWKWWLQGCDPKRLAQSVWTVGLCEDNLGRGPFVIHARRYTTGQCLPPYRSPRAVADKGFEQLVAKFGDLFLGFVFDEWDSDVWSVATGMKESPLWDEYPDAMPRMGETTRDEYRALHEQWQLFDRLSYGRIVPLNSWRCVDHYALQWGARCAFIEFSENGNPSFLTQIAFARGAARQYGKCFMTYQATMMGTGYTDYTPRDFDLEAQNVWATGPQFGPSRQLYRRLLFTQYLAGSTAMVFEHPQFMHVVAAKGADEYDLSPHGDVLADLLEYDAKYEQRGVAYQPVALLLDNLHGFSPPYHTCYAVGRSGMQTWFSIPYERGDHQVYQMFMTIFPWCRQRIERNGYPLVNTPFGDIFDVLVANPSTGPVAAQVLSDYRVAILAGDVRIDEALRQRLLAYVQAGGTLVANALHAEELSLQLRDGRPLAECQGVAVTMKQVGAGRVICTPQSDLLDDGNRALPVLGQLLAAIAAEVAPVRVDGDVQYHFLKTPTGWIVALFNNKGIVHHPRRKPQILSDETAVVRLQYRGDLRSSIDRINGEAIAWCGGADGCRTANVTVEPAGMRIIEIVVMP